jgi:hypothetical protein
MIAMRKATAFEEVTIGERNEYGIEQEQSYIS